ncbi:SRPBCC family protein [Streptomyces sp. SBST2-5]|uniref:SRPBCC family protein n=1 Tax=Streptomyces composti TaxID=2720025 RepID=A0ABX1AEQ3_9ACTN|nr:SRPBCC family protein [Streptomyces composti]NJP53169.1 SRPBCC family protein [Streptomyces composti]
MTGSSVAVERRMAAPPQRVWEALTNLKGMERTLKGVTKVEVLTPGPFGVGTRWRETRRMMGKEATEEMWVTACTPAQRYVVEAESHGMRYVSEWDLRPDGSSATTVRMTFTGTPTGRPNLLARLLGRFGAGAVRKAIAKDLDDIAASVERAGV